MDKTTANLIALGIVALKRAKIRKSEWVRKELIKAAKS
jgi:hypothetical protein